MFQLTPDEWAKMRSQFVTASQNKRNFGVTPFAFTEQGVAMLSGVLSSQKAIKMNIAIMRAFVEFRRISLDHRDLKKIVKELKKTLGEHDLRLNTMYDAIENLALEIAGVRSWHQRDKIGYKVGK